MSLPGADCESGRNVASSTRAILRRLGGGASDEALAQSEGFLVDSLDGEDLGVVDAVELDPRSGEVLRLEVVAGWFGRCRFDVDPADVALVFPDERRLFVARASLRRPHSTPRAPGEGR